MNDSKEIQIHTFDTRDTPFLKKERDAAQEKARRYELVAEILKNTTQYTKVSDLARLANMDEKEFRNSIQSAKKMLARNGVMITNKVTSRDGSSGGYKVATFEEYKTELNKSCSRAIAHVQAAATMSAILQKTTKHNFSEFIKNLQQNVSKINYADPSTARKFDFNDVSDMDHEERAEFFEEFSAQKERLKTRNDDQFYDAEDFVDED